VEKALTLAGFVALAGTVVQGLANFTLPAIRTSCMSRWCWSWRSSRARDRIMKVLFVCTGTSREPVAESCWAKMPA